MRLLCVLFLFASTISVGQHYTVTDFRDPGASGKLTLQVRNDTIRYICENLVVSEGSTKLCDNNKYIPYEYFIQRNAIDSSWLNDLMREYDYWIDVKDPGNKAPWMNFEKTFTTSYKEDFTAANQKTGITYKHHETRKNLVGYTFANPRGKIYHDDSKLQFQYDWEENIKGRFEAFYLDGIKKFRHNYEINRLMAMDKGFSGKKKTNIDAQVTGTIQSYYPNGKKKSIVTYTDKFVSEKTEEDSERKLTKSSRTGEKSLYRENGKLYCKGMFTLNGVDGKLEFYGPKGLAIIKIEQYKDGVLNGKVTEYYLDGEIKMKGEYKNGVKVGDWVYFDSEGNKSDKPKDQE